MAPQAARADAPVARPHGEHERAIRVRPHHQREGYDPFRRRARGGASGASAAEGRFDRIIPVPRA